MPGPGFPRCLGDREVVPEKGAEPQLIIAPCLCPFMRFQPDRLVLLGLSFIFLNVADFKGIQGQIAFWQGPGFEVRMSVGWCTLGAI